MPHTRRPRSTVGIPVSLRPFFQEYVLEDLDPERSTCTAIERALAWGDVAEWRWLFATYGSARRAGWRCLPRRRLKFGRCPVGRRDWHPQLPKARV